MSEDEYWVAEFSITQDAWHIDTLETTLDRNLAWCIYGRGENDYKVVAITSTSEEAHKIADLLKAEQEKRRTIRAQVELFPTAKNEDGVLYSYIEATIDICVPHLQRFIQAKFTEIPDEVTVGESFNCTIRLSRIPRDLGKILYQGAKFDIQYNARIIGQGQVIYCDLE